VFQAGLGLTAVQAFTNSPRICVPRSTSRADAREQPVAEADRARSMSAHAGLDTSVTRRRQRGRRPGWTKYRRPRGPALRSVDGPSEKMFTQIEQRMKDDYMRFLSE
jgi:hypothetical protein